MQEGYDEDGAVGGSGAARRRPMKSAPPGGRRASRKQRRAQVCLNISFLTIQNARSNVMLLKHLLNCG
jgi:hypothetical protein